MSLVAWWPLDSLKNKLSDNDLIESNSSACYQTTGGKVTNNVWRNTSHYGGTLYSTSKLNLGRKHSMFCWVYLEDIYSDASLNSICGQHRYPANCGMGITTRYINSSSCYLSVNTGDGGERTFNNYCGETVLNTGKWYHIGYVFEDGYLSLFVNGKAETIWLRERTSPECTNSKRYTDSHLAATRIIEDFFGVFMWSFSSGNVESSNPAIYSNYIGTGKINDVRVYDHALSLKEVEDVYNSCILHYDFNSADSLPYQNLLPSNVKKHTGGIGSYWSGAIAATTFDGYRCFSVTNAPSNGYGDGFIANVGTALTVGKTYTFSGYIYVPKDRTFRIGMRSKGGGNHVNIYVTGNSDWQFFSNTFTMIDDMTGNLEGSENSDYSSTVYYLRNLQITEGNIVPPFTDEARWPTTYDGSGFGNDGVANISSLSTDTNSGLYSAVFNGSNTYINADKGAKVTDAITVNIWAKGTNFGTGRLISCTEGGGWNLEENGEYIYFPIYISPANAYYGAKSTTKLSSLNDGKWHMITGTYDGSTIKIYVDGNLEGSTSVTGSIKYHADNSIFIGAEASTSATAPTSNYFNGNISEVEIFATALSAETIKSKYRSKISFSDKHTIRADLIEEKNVNLAAKMNSAIFRKTIWSNGVQSYTQDNCQVWITDEGLRIYRTPNIKNGSNGGSNSMWGGMKLSFLELGRTKSVSYTNTSSGAAATYTESDFFQKGHRYRISFHVKGYSSNAIEAIGFTNNMGWPGGGLNPTPSDVNYVSLPANFGIKNNTIVGDEKICFYEFTINDDVYKRCTGSYDSFVVGNIYPSYNHFEFRFGYTDTGTFGTELFITNIICEDVTLSGNITAFPPTATGRLSARAFEENSYGSTTPICLSDCGNILCSKVYEVGTHLSSTYIEGNLSSNGINSVGITIGARSAKILTSDIQTSKSASEIVTAAQAKAYIDAAFGI